MTTPLEPSARKTLRDLAAEVYAIWIGERPAQLAAALAYYGMFSFAPVIFVAYTLAGFIIDQTAAVERLFARIEPVLGLETATMVRDLVDALSVSDRTDSFLVSLVSFGALFFAASGLFFQLQYALNVVWRVPPPAYGQTQAFVTKRLASFVMVVGVSLLLIAAALVNLVLNWFGSVISAFFGFTSLPILLAWLASVGLIWLSFALLYRFLPDVRLELSDVWPGALVAALLVMLAATAATLFVGSAGLGSSLAAAGAFAVFLMAIYYIAQIFILGAVVTRVYAGMFGTLKPAGGEEHKPRIGTATTDKPR